MCWFLIGFIFPATIIQSTVYKRLGKRSHLIRLKGNPLPAGSLTAPTPSVYLHNLHLLNFSRVSLGQQSQNQLVAQFHLSKQAKRMTCSFQKSSLILRNAYETEVNTPFTQMLEANSCFHHKQQSLLCRHDRFLLEHLEVAACKEESD